ncbi:MAG TPA: amidohydrolase [Acholeplasmataceae bacterium]|nr:amidohydrolase [Acholeplasmataceae bacterium]
MDLILYNGKIDAMDNNIYEAIAIKDGRVFKIGKNEDILPLKTKYTNIIDLNTKVVLPGFNDSHMHLYNTGKTLDTINLLGVKSIKEVKEKVRNFIKKNPNLKIIKGRGWNQDYFEDESRFLTKDDLDEITIEFPLILSRACGHIATVNSKALEGIKKDIKIEGGYIDFDTGIVYENALNLFETKETKEEIKNTIIKAMKYANSYGITTVQSDDFGENYNLILESYQELMKENKLTTRIYEQCLLPSLDKLKKFINEGYFTGHGNDYFRIGPLKLLSDGSLGARTAALSKPYEDDKTNSGILIYEYDELEKIITYANNHKFQIAVHAIGDKAIYEVLNIYKKIIKDKNTLRHGIVHSQIMDEKLIDLYAKHDILAYIQPIFIHYDHRIVERRVGRSLAQTSYAFRTMLDKGINLSLGTDSPIEHLNPFANLYCAVTRKGLEGSPIGGWFPEESLSLYDAISLYTKGSSYSEFQEHQKGVLKPGYLADLIVLNHDIFSVPAEKLLDTKVEYTIVGGKIVYSIYK